MVGGCFTHLGDLVGAVDHRLDQTCTENAWCAEFNRVQANTLLPRTMLVRTFEAL